MTKPTTKSKSKNTKPVKKIQATPAKKEITVISVDSSNFEKLVLNSKTPVLLDVYADWCGPCRRMSPIFEEVSLKNKGKKITFAKLKMDGFEESDKHIKLLKEKLGTSITMIPTFLYIEKGKLVEQIVGSQSAPNLNTKIASLMKKPINQKRNLA
ncbi:MAG: thioredoxin 1 [Alteromonas naphthalenivorans]